VVAIDAVVYAFIESKGVRTTGDEPHYLVVAKALSHLTVHPFGTYLEDLRAHQIFAWPAGTSPTALNLQLYAGPHGLVSNHNLGLSALLAPFVGVGGARFGRLGLMAMEAAGVVYFFVRSANLAGLSRQAKVVFAIVIACPAIWLAGTQIYPDLLTGILIACVLVDLLAMERRRRLGWLPTTVSAASLAVLPWLHQQNLVPAVVLLLAFVPLAHVVRRWQAVLIIAAVSVASWLLLLVYNLYGYGHAVGLPQPFPSLNGAGVTEILGLLFDSHQGLFVQVPSALLGLIGLWLSRRTAPVAVVATLVSAGSLIYLNGTFIHAPYGGASFAGRFAWSALPPVMAWCPVAIVAIGRSSARLWGLAAGAAALWVFEAVPIVAGTHVYYNQLAAGAPWDVSIYPGWWGSFDRLLPVMIPGGRLFGRPWFGLLVVLGLLGLALWGARRLMRPPRIDVLRWGAGFVVVAAVAAGLTAVAPAPLPAYALTYPDSSLQGPLRPSPSGASTPAVPLVTAGAGTFPLTVDSTLVGTTGTLLSYCTPGSLRSAAAPADSASATIRPGVRRTVLTLHCPAGTIWFQMSVAPHTALSVSKLVLKKTANG
jgi:hypothetical protein